MQLQITYPFKPFNITQKWGNPNPAYSQQFGDPEFQLHNGVDAKADWNLKTYPVYCPVEGFYVASVGFDSNGGGNQIILRSKQKFQMGDKECYAKIYLLHGEKILVKAGEEPVLGQLLMIADNTGFSTGPHTHIGLYRVDKNGAKIDSNKATGSFDPAFFFNGIYAVNAATTATLIKSGLRYYQYLLLGS